MIMGIAYTEIEGKWSWFICDEHGRKLLGRVKTFETAHECNWDAKLHKDEYIKRCEQKKIESPL